MVVDEGKLKCILGRERKNGTVLLVSFLMRGD